MIWSNYFRVKKIGSGTYYAISKKKPSIPISPDFRSYSAAARWVEKNWKDIVFEEIVLE